MKKILVGIFVTAAVLASGYAGAAQTPNWSGLYVGANVGGGWGSGRSVNYSPNDPSSVLFFGPVMGAPPAASFDSSGALGGLQLGYNWQFNRNWLAGIETDFDWSGIRGSGSSTGATIVGNPFVATVDEQVKWFGTVRARLGYLPTNNLLTYVTGGFAYGQVDHTGNWINNGAPFGSHNGGFGVTCGGSGTTCFAGSSSSMTTGWTAGAGFEYALLQNITVKAEYLYVSLGGKSLTETAVVPFAGTTPMSFNANYGNTSFSVARAGFNYHF
jgi:outer membrane immunogenic protein